MAKCVKRYIDKHAHLMRDPDTGAMTRMPVDVPCLWFDNLNSWFSSNRALDPSDTRAEHRMKRYRELLDLLSETFTCVVYVATLLVRRSRGTEGTRATLRFC